MCSISPASRRGRLSGSDVIYDLRFAIYEQDRTFRGGRDGALRRPRRVQRRNARSHSQETDRLFRPLRRGLGHRSAMSLPKSGSWRASPRQPICARALSSYQMEGASAFRQHGNAPFSRTTTWPIDNLLWRLPSTPWQAICLTEKGRRNAPRSYRNRTPTLVACSLSVTTRTRRIKDTTIGPG